MRSITPYTVRVLVGKLLPSRFLAQAVGILPRRDVVVAQELISQFRTLDRKSQVVVEERLLSKHCVEAEGRDAILSRPFAARYADPPWSQSA